nr:MAG TPA: hypothetical protein [Caudoviricetes sp.]
MRVCICNAWLSRSEVRPVLRGAVPLGMPFGVTETGISV